MLVLVIVYIKEYDSLELRPVTVLPDDVTKKHLFH
jgi:hypothetical protein